MESPEKNGSERNPEAEAERLLEEILDNPANAFLHAHPKNMERINNADTSVQALAVAREIMFERDRRTFEFRALKEVEGVSFEDVRVEGIRSTIESIKANQEMIGEGGDAFVVIDRNEIRDLPPVICYKFAKQEATPRGRNPLEREAQLQGEVYDVAESLPDSRIGVPMPFYATEIGADKMIAMEKLPAKSVDDIFRGKGYLPEWLDIDVFCHELKLFLDELHSRGLFHRDMHVGNVMVRQSEEIPEDGKWGYVIDFGLSDHGFETMDPYRKEVAGQTFTYTDDYAIINQIKLGLKNVSVSSKGV